MTNTFKSEITKLTEKFGNEKIDYDKVIKQFPWIIERNHFFVISPDADGFYCAMLLTHFSNWTLCGFYNDRVLAIKEDYQQAFENNEIIFVDAEMFNGAVKSIGNHHLLPKNLKKFTNKDVKYFQCLNPNLLKNITQNEFRLKYPFGTVHFLLSILAYSRKDSLFDNLANFINSGNSNEKIAAIEHPDGTAIVWEKYAENSKCWSEYLRFNEPWNPMRYNPTRNELIEGRIAFYNEKRDKYSQKNQRGDRLSLTNTRGEFEAIEKYGETYRIKKNNLDSVLGFLKAIFNIFEIEFSEEKFDCWDNLVITRFEKANTKPTDECFHKILNEHNIISYAYTKTNCLEYTYLPKVKTNNDDDDVNRNKRGRKVGYRKPIDAYISEYRQAINDVLINGMTFKKAAVKYGKNPLTLSRVYRMFLSKKNKVA